MKRPRRLTAAEWNELKTAHMAGAGLRQLARAAGIKPHAILSRARREKWTEQRDAGKALANHAQQSDSRDLAPVSTPAQAAARSLGEGNPGLTLKEKRNFLRSVVTTPIGQVDESSPLAQSVKRRSRTTRSGDVETETDIRVPDKLRALELDAKLAGELDGSERGGAVMVNIALLGMTLEERTVVELTDAAGSDPDPTPPLPA